MRKALITVLSKLLLWLVKPLLAKAVLMDSKGNFIKPFHPECNTLDLEVVALALSRIMRFFGQTKLSVAQHSVNMAKIFIYQGKIELAKQALLHEVSEAFMGDLASPLKAVFPMFTEIEESLIEKTFKCYGLSYPMHERVHQLDKTIVLDEAINHMPNKQYWQSLGSGLSSKTIREANVDFNAWNSQKAYDEFI